MNPKKIITDLQEKIDIIKEDFWKAELKRRDEVRKRLPKIHLFESKEKYFNHLDKCIIPIRELKAELKGLNHAQKFAEEKLQDVFDEIKLKSKCSDCGCTYTEAGMGICVSCKSKVPFIVSMKEIEELKKSCLEK